MDVDPHHILIEDPDGSCTLILDNLTSADSGQYMCFAASAAGNASTLGKILVQGEPGREAGWAPRPHPPQQSPRRCRHSDELGVVVTSDPSLGNPWSGWGPAHYAFSLSLSLCSSLCVSISPSFLSVSLPLPSSVCVSQSISPCLCVSLHFSLSLSVSLPFSFPPCGPTVPPRFVNKVRAVPFVEGEDTQVTCTIEGAPHPQIRWVRWTRGWACPRASTSACKSRVGSMFTGFGSTRQKLSHVGEKWVSWGRGLSDTILAAARRTLPGWMLGR